MLVKKYTIYTPSSDGNNGKLDEHFFQEDVHQNDIESFIGEEAIYRGFVNSTPDMIILKQEDIKEL